VLIAVLAVPAAALAAGKVWVIDTPSCITTHSVTTAKEQYKPAKIVLGCSQHEGQCPGAAHTLFTNATFSFPKKQPPSPTGQGTYGLPCGGPQAATDSRSRISRPPLRAGS
jgi:hypothetical protein